MDLLKDLKLPWITAIETITEDVRQGDYLRLTVKDSSGKLIYWKDSYSTDIANLEGDNKLWEFIVHAVNTVHTREQGFEEWFEKEFHMTYKEALDYPKYFTSTPSLYALKKAWLASNNGRKELAPQDVYDMATQSLPPDEFVELERILVMLCETRKLKLKIHEISEE